MTVKSVVSEIVHGVWVMDGKRDSLLIKSCSSDLTFLITEMAIRTLTVFNLMLKVFSGD
jgi:hypothetical protein